MKNSGFVLALSRFLKGKEGAVGLEFALLVPILIVIVLGLYSANMYQRTDNTLHRETASMADILVNAPDGIVNEEGEFVEIPLEELLPMRAESARVLLQRAFSSTDPHSVEVGVKLFYVNTSVQDDKNVPIVMEASAGSTCPISKSLSMAERMRPGETAIIPYTEGDGMLFPVPKLRLLRIETCVIPTFGDLKSTLKLPVFLTSEFTAMRGNND